MKKLFIVLFALMAGMTWAQQSPVTAGSDGKSWTLATRSFIYQIRVSDQGKVNMFYFGDKSQNPDMLRNPLGEEITVRGGYSATTPMLEAVFKDRVRDIELTYEGSEILTQDGYATLVIRQKDNYYPLAVTEYIRVLPEYDLLEKWVEIKNTGKKGNIEIENAQSGTFFLPKNAYELTHLTGDCCAQVIPAIKANNTINSFFISYIFTLINKYLPDYLLPKRGRTLTIEPKHPIPSHLTDQTNHFSYIQAN